MVQGLCVAGSKDAATCLSAALPRYNSACDESIPPETNQFLRSTNQFFGLTLQSFGLTQQSFGCESICRICATILTKGCQKPTGDTHQRINATPQQFCRLHTLIMSLAEIFHKLSRNSVMTGGNSGGRGNRYKLPFKNPHRMQAAISTNFSDRSRAL